MGSNPASPTNHPTSAGLDGPLTRVGATDGTVRLAVAPASWLTRPATVIARSGPVGARSRPAGEGDVDDRDRQRTRWARSTARGLAALGLAAVLVTAGCSDDGDDATSSPGVEADGSSGSTAPVDPRRAQLVELFQATGSAPTEASCLATAVLDSMPADQIGLLVALGPNPDPAALSPEETAAVGELFRLGQQECGLNPLAGTTTP